jgi:hypothetical protein
MAYCLGLDGPHQAPNFEIYGGASLMAVNDHILWSLGASLKETKMKQRQRRSHTKKEAPSKLGKFQAFQQTKYLGERNAPCLQILNITQLAMEPMAITCNRVSSVYAGGTTQGLARSLSCCSTGWITKCQTRRARLRLLGKNRVGIFWNRRSVRDQASHLEEKTENGRHFRMHATLLLP